MQQTKITIYAGITIALLSVGFFVIYTRVTDKKELLKGFDIVPIGSTQNKKISDIIAMPDILDGELYIHKNPVFSFKYPEGFKVVSTQNSAAKRGEIIVVEESEKKSFQVLITPFDEPNPITKARILRDVPDMLITEESNIIMVGGIKAFGFKSEDEAVGETYEIWFVAGGNLFQISAPFSFKESLMNILVTWTFQTQ